MSWQQYVDAVFAGGQAVEASGFFGLDGSSWASKNLDATPEEIKRLINAIKNVGAAQKDSYGQGIFLAGEKYSVIKFEDNEIWKGASRSPERAACAYLTNSCVIVAIATGGHSASGQLNVQIQKFQNFLKENGY